VRNAQASRVHTAVKCRRTLDFRRKSIDLRAENIPKVNYRSPGLLSKVSLEGDFQRCPLMAQSLSLAASV
jgi:hypothetical protein